MKEKMKSQGSTELPRFAVGALAIAGASAANGATVQITFAGSYISTTGGNQLVTDFGGDRVNDMIGTQNATGTAAVFGILFPGRLAVASGYRSASNYAIARIEGGAGGKTKAFQLVASRSARDLAAVRFSDANIRGGAPTNGWLDITAVASQPGEKRVTVNRLIFDDASATAPTGLTSASTGIAEWSAVPEPSSLGLLALGAGGLLARRRRAMAA